MWSRCYTLVKLQFGILFGLACLPSPMECAKVVITLQHCCWIESLIRWHTHSLHIYCF
jgi:hypothetical protein